MITSKNGYSLQQRAHMHMAIEAADEHKKHTVTGTLVP